MELYVLCALSLLLGIFFGYISAGRIYFEKFLSLTYSLYLGILSRIDKMLCGNDGCYSHTRFLNLVWGIGGFSLICVAVLRKINIPGEVLVLMGSGMGISGIQAVMNKANELKFVSSKPVEPVANGDNNA